MNSEPKIKYSTSLSGTWSEIDFKKYIQYSSNSTDYITNFEMTAFKCANGYCVFAASYVEYESDDNGEYNNGGHAVIFTATNPTNTWTYTKIFNELPRYTASILDLAYGNGTWCFVARVPTKHIADEDHYGGYVGWASNPTGSWSKRQIFAANGDGYAHSFNAANFVNGYFILREYSHTSRATYYYQRYSTTPSAVKADWKSISTAGVNADSVAYFDGQYIFPYNTAVETGMWSGKYNTTAGFDYAPSLDSVTADWTKKTLWQQSSVPSSSSKVSHVNVLNGILFVCGTKYDTATSTSYAHISIASSLDELTIE